MQNGQYKIYNKDGTGGHWYISKESAEQISGQIEPLVGRGASSADETTGNTYFVSYAHIKGFGNVAINLTYAPRNIEDLRDIAATIEQTQSVKDAIILNWLKIA